MLLPHVVRVAVQAASYGSQEHRRRHKLTRAIIAPLAPHNTFEFENFIRFCPSRNSSAGSP